MLFPSGRSINLVPPIAAIAVTYNASISSSVTVSFNAATTLIEVSAIDKGILLRWGGSAATTTLFDEFIQAGTTRQYYLPTGVTQANFLQEAATGKLVLIQK